MRAIARGNRELAPTQVGDSPSAGEPPPLRSCRGSPDVRADTGLPSCAGDPSSAHDAPSTNDTAIKRCRLIALVRSGRLDPTPLITHHFPLDRITEAYDLFANRRDGVLKVAITP
jgi:hypothetical protein